MEPVFRAPFNTGLKLKQFLVRLRVWHLNERLSVQRVDDRAIKLGGLPLPINVILGSIGAGSADCIGVNPKQLGDARGRDEPKQISVCKKLFR